MHFRSESLQWAVDLDGGPRIWASSEWRPIDYCYKTDLGNQGPMGSPSHYFSPDHLTLNLSLGHWVQVTHPFPSSNIKRPSFKAQASENAVYGGRPGWTLDLLAQLWWTELGRCLLLVHSRYWSQNHCFVKSWLDASAQAFKRKDLTFPNPCSLGFCCSWQKPPLWPARSPALLSPAPVAFPLEPLQPLPLRLRWMSASINLTGCSPPKPFSGLRAKKRLRVRNWKSFYVPGFSCRYTSQKIAALLFLGTWLILYQHKSRRLCQPPISFHRMRTSGNHGNHSINWQC